MFYFKSRKLQVNPVFGWSASREHIWRTAFHYRLCVCETGKSYCYIFHVTTISQSQKVICKPSTLSLTRRSFSNFPIKRWSDTEELNLIKNKSRILSGRKVLLSTRLKKKSSFLKQLWKRTECSVFITLMITGTNPGRMSRLLFTLIQGKEPPSQPSYDPGETAGEKESISNQVGIHLICTVISSKAK